MKTVEFTAAEMASRVSRFKDLKPLPTQTDGQIPIAARDFIYAREIYSVIGMEKAKSPVSMGAPITGAGGMTLGIAKCPPGQGPDLHAHQRTFETFTILRGRFEVRWNDDGDQSLILDEFDTISIPPGVCRAFRNIGNEDGLIQAIITGGEHDMQDIDFAKPVADQLASIDPQAPAYFEKIGFTFTASRDG